MVFTIPKIISELLLFDKITGYNILFKSSARTIQEACENINNIGAKPGFISVLHTWDQKLLFHPHIHMIIPGGGLSEDNSEWIPAAKDYFINTHKLSLIFRGKFISYFKKVVRDNKWVPTKKIPHFDNKGKIENILSKSCEHKWGVYCKPTFKNTADVFDYLGRYTHRIAISNNRIKVYKNNEVTFSYKDRKDNDKVKDEKISALSFVRRFLLHIVPNNFYKIRYFGFMANVIRKKRIAQCQDALNMDKNKIEEKLNLDFVSIMKIFNENFLICPKCKVGRIIEIEELYRDFYAEDKEVVLDTT